MFQYYYHNVEDSMCICNVRLVQYSTDAARKSFILKRDICHLNNLCPVTTKLHSLSAVAHLANKIKIFFLIWHNQHWVCFFFPRLE